MMIYNKIVKTGIVAITITALIAVYFSPGMGVLCSANESTSTGCCQSESKSNNIHNSNSSSTLSIQSAHKCVCPSMQSGQPKFDEVLPNTVKTDSKYNITEIVAPASLDIIPLPLSKPSFSSYAHSYLSAKDKLCFLQTFLI